MADAADSDRHLLSRLYIHRCTGDGLRALALGVGQIKTGTGKGRYCYGWQLGHGNANVSRGRTGVAAAVRDRHGDLLCALRQIGDFARCHRHRPVTVRIHRDTRKRYSGNSDHHGLPRPCNPRRPAQG
ncbi:hypothetical protein SRABI106_03148 [Rahnella aquatilis]|nr:hypothetical protein SRABI106_03148 [Rahnella aquatilis]